MHGRYRPKYLPYPICLLCKEIMHMHAFQTTLQRQVVTESGCMCVGALCEQNGGRGVIKYIYTFTDTQKYWQHMLSQKYEYSFCYTCTGAPFFPPVSMRMFSTPPPPLPPHPTSIRRLTRLIPGFRSVIITTNYIPTLPSSSSISLLHPSPFLILSLA